MSVMAFLKILSEIALVFAATGPIAVHYGAGVWQTVLTLVIICLAETASYIIYERLARSGNSPGSDVISSYGTSEDDAADAAKRAGRLLRLVPFAVPFICLAFPGKCIAWYILTGIMLAYGIYIAITEKYMSEPEHQRTLFIIALVLSVLMIIILAFAQAKEISFTISFFSGIMSIACSVLIMRSLRHDVSVYATAKFQLVNAGLVAVVAAVIALLCSNTVLGGILAVLKRAYSWIASGVLYVVMLIIRGISAFIAWLSSLLAVRPQGMEPEPIELNTQSMEDMFGEQGELVAIPGWIKVLLICLAVLAVIGIILLIFRAISGRKADEVQAAAGETSVTRLAGAGMSGKKRNDPADIRGVRKQYRQYLHFLKSKGMYIDPSETSAQIEDGAPDEYHMAEASELRELYIEARYNQNADPHAAERARELVKIIRKGTVQK